MKNKAVEHINKRSWLLLIGLLAVTGGILYKLFVIEFIQGAHYRELAQRYTIRTFKVKAERGNIYSEDERLLAISAPFYTVHFDPMVIKSDKDYYAHLPALSRGLARITGKPADYWQRKLRKARREKRRYVLIAKDLSYDQFDAVRKLPLFKRGRYKGGFIYDIRRVRKYPFGNMMKRTIGASNEITKYGLEGAYDKILRGEDGERLKQRINSKQWKPVNDFNEKEPVNGYDLVTTMNMQMQDIAHQSLLQQLKKYKADHGTLVLMEVKTGAVKAIVNLKRRPDGSYKETRNYAVYEKIEPGSLFKTFTFLTWFEDGVADTSDVYRISKRWKYYDRYISDAHHYNVDRLSIADAFVKSSNIITAKVTDKYYRTQPERFTGRLIGDFGLGEKLHLDIKGESEPVIPHPGQKDWKAYKLGMMSFGYGVQLTPLQILTVYNGIANGGRVMKPYFVREIQNKGHTVKKIKPQTLNNALASPKNIDKIRKLMRQVVERGTAVNVNSPYVKIAGKTGTTQTDYWTSDIQYIASFAGFFPYDNPKYSMIVVIHKPDKSMGYYGNQVAGTVFREVAEQVYGITPQKMIAKNEE